MNTYLAVLLGAVIGSLAKSLFENLIPNSLKEYFKAKRDLEFHFIRLYKQANKLHNDLKWHRNNVIKGKGASQTPNYYLNLAYTFYRFQAVRKIIDETMDENFIRLPKRYLKFESIDRLVSKSINSKNYFDFEDLDFEYLATNTISKIRYEKVISFMIVQGDNPSKTQLMNVHDFEKLLHENKLVKEEYDVLLSFFKEMEEDSFAFQRLHLIIEMLKLLKANIDINNDRKTLIDGVSTNNSKTKAKKQAPKKLSEILNRDTFEMFKDDLEGLRNTGNKVPNINTY